MPPTRHLETMDRIAGYPNPFEAYLLAAASTQGVLVALGVAHSAALDATLGAAPWLRWTWAALMALGGCAAILGLYWPADPFTGVEIKRVGLVATGFGALIYAFAVWSLGRSGVITGLSSAAFAAACFVRTWQVTQLLRRAEAVVTVQRVTNDG